MLNFWNGTGAWRVGKGQLGSHWAAARALAIVIILALGFSAHADTLHVPGAYSTIQVAVDAAASGDTIVLADGIYSGPGNQDLTLTSKALTFTSANGRTNCIIDCGNSSRFIQFSGLATAGSVVSGLTIRNSRVIGAGGGGIYVINDASVDITNCHFQNCDAEVTDQGTVQGGGAVQATLNGQMDIDLCKFVENTCAVWDGEFYYGLGGAVRMQNSAQPGSITNCMFINNTAAHGGAMAVNNATTPNLVSNCTFDGNSGYYTAGALLINHLANVDNCTFTNNTAQFGGGLAFQNPNGAGLVSNCQFIGNHAIGDPLNPGAQGFGGALRVINGAEPTFFNCTFNANIADSSGGAVITGGGSNGEFIDCTFNQNQAFFGGAMQFEGGSCALGGCDFTGNVALADPSVPGWVGMGGALRVGVGANPVISNCAFQSNTATTQGGAVLMQNSSGQFSNCAFTENLAVFGGAIDCLSSTVVVSTCAFQSNAAQSNPAQGFTGLGGAMRLFASSQTVSHTTFESNHASAGGAINFANSSGLIDDCMFQGNHADPEPAIPGALGVGGAVRCQTASNPTFTNCIFRQNNASRGGAIQAEGAGVNASTPIFRNCLIHDNTASDFGNGGFAGAGWSGGISTVVTYTNCTVAGNSAATGGGGLTTANGANAIVQNSILFANAAPIGSQIYLCGTCAGAANPSFANVSWSLVQGGQSMVGVFAGTLAWGAGNLDADPLIVGGKCSNLELNCRSPAVNAGNDALVPAAVTTDLCDEARIFGSAVDMGAIELQMLPVTGDTNCDGLVNVVDLLAVIAQWGPCPAPPSDCSADIDGDGSVTVTDLLLVISNWS